MNRYEKLAIILMPIMMIILLLVMCNSCTTNFVSIHKCIYSEGDACMHGSNLEDVLKGNRQESSLDIKPPIFASPDGN